MTVVMRSAMFFLPIVNNYTKYGKGVILFLFSLRVGLPSEG